MMKDFELKQHVVCLLNSYRHWLKKDLLLFADSTLEERLFNAPFILVSHGSQSDPILNYGNRRALELWEMTWDEFTRTPSRLTAEPEGQADRTRLLAEVTKNGFISDYTGVRLSKSGKRFRIKDATVWNLFDETGAYCGQAAMFDTWIYL